MIGKYYLRTDINLTTCKHWYWIPTIQTCIFNKFLEIGFLLLKLELYVCMSIGNYDEDAEK